MEKAKLKEKIGLAMLEKLREMCSESTPSTPKPSSTGRLYPQLPTAPEPPPYEGSELMAPVLDVTATVNYNKRPEGHHDQAWVPLAQDRGPEIDALLTASRSLRDGITELSRIQREEKGRECTSEQHSMEGSHGNGCSGSAEMDRESVNDRGQVWTEDSLTQTREKERERRRVWEELQLRRMKQTLDRMEEEHRLNEEVRKQQGGTGGNGGHFIQHYTIIMMCYRCGGNGHYARNCGRPPHINKA